MLDAEPIVCTDCGNLHMESGQGPNDIDECVVCDGDVEDVELEDVIGL
jgi:hypothetical protein